MQAAGLKLINADVTVLAEAPRIAAHRGAMAAKLAADLGVAAQRINIKATTTERLGFIGRGEGLAALASVLARALESSQHARQVCGCMGNRPHCSRLGRTATPLSPANFKAVPEDFHVEEQLSFEPSGSGPHWLLRVEKRSANTRWVAAEMARAGRRAERRCGIRRPQGPACRRGAVVQRAGLAARRPNIWNGVRTSEFKVLETFTPIRASCGTALCRATAFASACAMCMWSREQLEFKLETLRTHGAPNYFGPQRFGRDGYNLDRVAAWLHGGAAPRGRAERSFHALGGTFLGVQRRARAAGGGGRLVAACVRRPGQPRRQRQSLCRHRRR